MNTSKLNVLPIPTAFVVKSVTLSLTHGLFLTLADRHVVVDLNLAVDIHAFSTAIQVWYTNIVF